MRRILAIRNDRFGEFLLNIPAFRALKETWPGAELHVVVAPGVEEIAGAVPFIDKVLVRAGGWRPLVEDIAFILQLRREKYDAAVVFNPSRESHHIVFWAGIPVRAGYARKHHFLLTTTMEDNKDLGLRHEVDSNLGLVELIGARTADKSLTLRITEEFKNAVRERFCTGRDELIAVHPWTSDPIKQWPLENFEALIKGICRGFRGKVVVIGKPESWHRELVLEGFPANVIDLQCRTSLVEAAAVLSQCRCLVSCDSGPVHLAAAVHTPVVALYRNDMPGKNPERWGPWGEKNVVVQRPKPEDISVEDVLTVVGQFIN